MLVITEDLVRRAHIKIGQSRATPSDLEELSRQAASSLPPANPLQPFLGGSAHGGRHCFSGGGGEFADEFLVADP